MKKVVSAILLALFSISFAYSSHLVGGELGIEHKQGSTYKVFMLMYYDQLHGDFGTDENSVTLNVFEKGTNNLVRTLALPKISSTPLEYTFPACTGSSLQTTIFRYEAEFNLSPNEFAHPAGYYLSWERCCRNEDIVNIQDPGATGMVFYMEFPALKKNNIQFINSSPVLNPVAGDNLCTNELHTYSFAATDKDGDELRYFLVTPKKGFTTPNSPLPPKNPAPYPDISWKNTYSALDAIHGNPQLNLNALTGLLSVRPTDAGLFVFSVLVEEYRNGNKIGEVIRDFQWNVVNCQQNNPPVVSVLKSDNTIYLESETLVVSSAESQCFDVLFSDQIKSNLTFEIVPINFTTPTLSISPSSGTINQENEPVKAEFCWPDCSISRPEPYIFDIVVRDKACPLPKSGRVRVKLLVNPVPNDPPAITTSLGADVMQYLQIGETITFDVTGTDPDNDLVTLTAEGEGFSVPGLGMQFNGGSGQGTHTSVFSWTPGCNALTVKQPMRVVFKAKDNSCFSENQDTTSVQFVVTDVPSKEADFIPANIFTPNGDGFNDTFQFPTLPADNCQGTFEETEIFSRWGQRVFKATTRTAGWDASSAPDGIYYYLIRFSHKVYKGTVTVVR